MMDGFTLATEAVRETARALDACTERIQTAIQDIKASEKHIEERPFGGRIAVPATPPSGNTKQGGKA